jgi:hypothetical protein
VKAWSKEQFLPRAAVISMDIDKPIDAVPTDIVLKNWKSSYENKISQTCTLKCKLDNSTNPNLYVSFERLDSNIVYVFTSRILNEFRHHGAGRIYVFKFDKELNFKVRKWGWQE